MHAVTIVLAITVAFASIGSAQSPLPSTPNTCREAIAALEQSEQNKVRDTKLSPPYTSQQATKVVNELIERCVAQFDPNTVDDTELLSLFKLYKSIKGDSVTMAEAATKAQLTMQRAISNTTVSAEERVERLLQAIDFFSSDRTTQSLALRQLAVLDTFAGATVPDRINARRSLLSKFDVENSDKTWAIAEQIETLAVGLDSAALSKLTGGVDMTDVKAEIYGDQGRSDLSIQLYEAKIERLKAQGTSPTNMKFVQQQLESYQRIGSKGVPIVAAHWLNAPPSTKEFVPRGKATLIMFTAHWCTPCKTSYPIIARLHERYSQDGLETVVVTKTFGYFAKRAESLSTDEEIAANKQFYVDQYHLNMPLAIHESRTDTTTDRDIPDPNEVAYRVKGYPTYIILDRDGIIRYTSIGWGHKSEGKLVAALDRVLAVDKSR